jgi:hypothetical protein
MPTVLMTGGTRDAVLFRVTAAQVVSAEPHIGQAKKVAR